jgi:ATP-dependent RNA helicase DeaD
MVFCNTKKKVDELTQELSDKGFAVEGLHGDMSQHLRNKVMNNVRNSNIKVLVATDVAARGIDVENVEAVFNYDVPLDQEYYVHRIGRTGRAGKSGLAFTFTYGRSYRKLKDIQRYIKANIEKIEIPSAKSINKKRMNEFYKKIEAVLKEGDLGDFISPVEKLIDKDYSSIEIAAALIKMNLPKPLKEKEFEMVTSHKSKNINSEAVRLFINVGKSHGIKVNDIVGAIVNECGISGRDVGQITLLSRFSYVDVERSQAEKVIRKMNESSIKGNSVNVEIAKPRKNEYPKNEFRSKKKSYDSSLSNKKRKTKRFSK